MAKFTMRDQLVWIFGALCSDFYGIDQIGECHCHGEKNYVVLFSQNIGKSREGYSRSVRYKAFNFTLDEEDNLISFTSHHPDCSDCSKYDTPIMTIVEHAITSFGGNVEQVADGIYEVSFVHFPRDCPVFAFDETHNTVRVVIKE